MANLQITKLGMIKGGVCEKLFIRRAKREQGTRLAVDWLLNNNCINIHNGWCKITKVPKKLLSMSWVIPNICRLYGGDAEIGWRRFISEIAMPLCEKGKCFRLSQIKKWGASKAALEFSLGSTIGACKMAYSPPHQGELYKKWANPESRI